MNQKNYHRFTTYLKIRGSLQELLPLAKRMAGKEHVRVVLRAYLSRVNGEYLYSIDLMAGVPGYLGFHPFLQALLENKNENYRSEEDGFKTVLWIKWRGIQGNMELRPSELSIIAALGYPLAMDYIFMPQDQWIEEE